MISGIEKKNKLIGILDLNTSNLLSIYYGIYNIGYDPIIINHKNFDKNYGNLTHLIIPGVGNFGEASKNIDKFNLRSKIIKFSDSQRPIMGICLGMQLLFTKSMESQDYMGLDLIKGDIKKISNFTNYRIPHVGWNGVKVISDHFVTNKIKDNVYDFYFVHSYFIPKLNNKFVLGQTEYDVVFPSIVFNKNIIGVQFHPEKSQLKGISILENFCKWDGVC